jgi:predicted nucleotidyltransferase
MSPLANAADPTPDEALEAALDRAFTEAPVAVVSAYLFGSVAEGRAHVESDIDIGVLLPRVGHDGMPTSDRSRFEDRIHLTSWLIGELHHNDMDVVVLNDAPPLLGRRVVTGGCRVWCADAEADHAFVRDVQLRAADLEPFLRRTRQVKLAAIRR